MKKEDLGDLIKAILLLIASTCDIRKSPGSPCYNKKFDLAECYQCVWMKYLEVK